MLTINIYHFTFVVLNEEKKTNNIQQAVNMSHIKCQRHRVIAYIIILEFQRKENRKTDFYFNDAINEMDVCVWVSMKRLHAQRVSFMLKRFSCRFYQCFFSSSLELQGSQPPQIIFELICPKIACMVRYFNPVFLFQANSQIFTGRWISFTKWKSWQQYGQYTFDGNWIPNRWGMAIKTY